MRAKIATLLAAIAAAVGALGAATWAKRRQAGDELELEVTEPTSSTPQGKTAVAPAPASTAAASSDGAGAAVSDGAGATDEAAAAVDDLTAIKGLGKVKVAKLATLGITSYAQVAAWTEEDIAEVGLQVNTSPGQIKREDWVGQAKALAEG